LFRSAAGLDLNFAGGVFSLNNTSAASPANIPGWSFSRTDTNGIATALDLAGNVIQFATGVPRITNRGILVEEARTNSVLWSIDFSQINSGNNLSSTVSTNVGPAPDGTTTADRVELTAGVGFRYTRGASVAAGTYTGTFWIRASTPADVRCRLSRAFAAENAAVTASVTTAWQRVSISLTTTATDQIEIGVDARVSTGANGNAVDVEVWGFQIELGAFATSPIITTGAAGTRNGDQPAAGTSVLTPEGTIILTYIVPPAAAAVERLFGWRTEDSGNSRLALRIGETGNQTAPAMVVGDGTAVSTLTGSSLTPGTTAKVACSYSTLSAQAALCVNGTDQTVARQTASSMLSTLFQIGQATGDFSATGPILRLQIIPRFLSAAERIALTAP
jgi:hypothetical protein